MSESDTSARVATILIVDNDDITAIDLQQGLLGAGYDVRRVDSARAARGALKSVQADLILISLLLPDADGLSLCASLSTQAATPIIVLTERESEIDRALALQSGALDCLSHPVDRGALLTEVRALVQRPPVMKSR